MSAGANGSPGTDVGSGSRLVIGLTGPIAAGKSTVAAMLADRGAEVIDADAVYRTLLDPGSDLAKSLARRFGPSIVQNDGEIDRAALASIVFSDATALADLDRITHPAVVDRVRHLIDRSRSPVIVVEAVKLVESGLAADVDAVWRVTADPDVRLHRLTARPGIDKAAAMRRLAAEREAQSPPGTLEITIDNSGGLDSTERQVDGAWRVTLKTRTQPVRR